MAIHSHSHSHYPSHCKAGQGKARQSKAKHSTAQHSTAKQSKAKQSKAKQTRMTIFMHCENTPKTSTVLFTVSVFLGFPKILTALAFQSSRCLGCVLFWDISNIPQASPSLFSLSFSLSSGILSNLIYNRIYYNLG